MQATTENKLEVLLVEDEEDIRQLMALHLKREGLEVVECSSGEAALKALSNGEFSVVILDWMLPKTSGLEITKMIQGRIPILMVTARADPADIVLGIEMGADDYITKPFEIPVFLARVRALLRRQSRIRSIKSAEKNLLAVGNLSIDSESFDVYCADQQLKLTRSEFRLLQALMENRGKVLSRERLVSLVQGADISVTNRTIDTHVFGLRKKLGDCADIIETIRGVGYIVRG